MERDEVPETQIARNVIPEAEARRVLAASRERIEMEHKGSENKYIITSIASTQHAPIYIVYKDLTKELEEMPDARFDSLEKAIDYVRPLS